MPGPTVALFWYRRCATSSSFTFGWAIIQSMMTKPGEQFVIRRNALAMIRNAFQENGIEFAVPTVQVAGRSRRGG